jgi:hypothetical protein
VEQEMVDHKEMVVQVQLIKDMMVALTRLLVQLLQVVLAVAVVLLVLEKMETRTPSLQEEMEELE